ncbi:MAG: cbb3-type cytochrome c oxidase subunit I [Chitinophagaceae bacterium]|nr:MAG: cbb3-type cytochrome c oxidase subunit I [Chitinophagaceae bacterium]
MAALLNESREFPRSFIVLALFVLAFGLLAGLAGGLQYIIPGFIKHHLSFERVRPMHVSAMVFWIILSASGGALTYVLQHNPRGRYSLPLLKLQFVLFSIALIAILVSYCYGVFGGREYWEFPPAISLLILGSWILFIINFIKALGSRKNQPVFVWMWLTGLFFFLFTFVESYLWLLPWFGNNVVNDMTIQWKSYGSMVGSWNMLMNGCAIFLMDKISGTKTYGHSRIAFLLYFTGLFNLMFNWGHHIYTLPTHGYVKYISYGVSMTELFILGKIIYSWRSSLGTAKKFLNRASYRFLFAADVWIFVNLTLAIAMSVPGINVYTHGTHVTVAHTMGATIGINTFILLAVAYDILSDNCSGKIFHPAMVNRGLIISNVSLFIFWMSLIIAGVIKAKWQMDAEQVPFSSMMAHLRPYFISFVVAGAALSIGLFMVIVPLLKSYFSCIAKGGRYVFHKVTA